MDILTTVILIITLLVLVILIIYFFYIYSKNKQIMIKKDLPIVDCEYPGLTEGHAQFLLDSAVNKQGNKVLLRLIVRDTSHAEESLFAKTKDPEILERIWHNDFIVRYPKGTKSKFRDMYRLLPPSPELLPQGIGNEDYTNIIKLYVEKRKLGKSYNDIKAQIEKENQDLLILSKSGKQTREMIRNYTDITKQQQSFAPVKLSEEEMRKRARF